MSRRLKTYPVIGGLVTLHMVLAVITTYAGAGGVSAHIFVLLLFAVLLFPILLRRKKSLMSIWMLESLYFAFIPAVDMAMLYGLLGGRKLFRIEPDVNRALILLSTAPAALVPVLIGLAALGALKASDCRKALVGVLCLDAVLGVSMFIFPETAQVALYFAVYAMILLAHDWFHKVFATVEDKGIRILLWVCVVLIWGKGCYHMLLLWEAYGYAL